MLSASGFCRLHLVSGQRVDYGRTGRRQKDLWKSFYNNPGQEVVGLELSLRWRWWEIGTSWICSKEASTDCRKNGDGAGEREVKDEPRRGSTDSQASLPTTMPSSTPPNTSLTSDYWFPPHPFASLSELADWNSTFSGLPHVLPKICICIPGVCNVWEDQDIFRNVRSDEDLKGQMLVFCLCGLFASLQN